MLHWLFCKKEYNRFRSRTRFCRRNLILVYGKRVPLRYERVRSPGKYGGLRRNQPYLLGSHKTGGHRQKCLCYIGCSARKSIIVSVLVHDFAAGILSSCTGNVYRSAMNVYDLPASTAVCGETSPTFARLPGFALPSW